MSESYEGARKTDKGVKFKDCKVVECEKEEVKSSKVMLTDKCLICPYWGICEVR